MLEKLTKKQEILMYATRDKYLKRFFSLPKINKVKATKFIKWIYSLSGLKEPMVLFVDSPIACQIACNLIGRDKVENQVWIQVWNQVSNQVRNQVENQVENQVWNKVWGKVWNQVLEQVRNQVGGKVLNEVENQALEQVENQVLNQVLNQVENQVENQVWNKVRSQVWNQVSNQARRQELEYFKFGNYADYSDFGWVSFYDFFSQIGILKNKEFNQYKKLIDTGIFATIQMDKLCIVSSMPTKICRSGIKLHNPDGYAVEFADGYGQHYLYGVYFSPEDFEKVKTMTAKEALNIKNIEQRMAILKLFGAEKILNEIGAKLIDSSERGNKLYSIDGITSKTEKILKYVCPSTGRIYVKFVKPHYENADLAQAESHHFTLEQYNNLQWEA